MQSYVCPFDDTPMQEKELPFSLDIKGVTLPVRGLLQCVCPTCGSDLVPFDMMRENARKVADAKRAHLGLLSGAEITRIRAKVLGLSRSAASTLLVGGRNAFQKYEAEGQLQSHPTDKLLRALAHSPSALAALGGKSPAVLPSMVEKPTVTVDHSTATTVESVPNVDHFLLLGSSVTLGKTHFFMIDKSDHESSSAAFDSEMVRLDKERGAFMHKTITGVH